MEDAVGGGEGPLVHHGGEAVSGGGELGDLCDVVLGDGGVAGDLAQSVGLL